MTPSNIDVEARNWLELRIADLVRGLEARGVVKGEEFIKLEVEMSLNPEGKPTAQYSCRRGTGGFCV